MDVRDLFDYSDNCRTLLRETLLAHPDVFDRRFETLSKYASVRLLVAHSMAAEERWIEMRIRGRQITPYEDRAAEAVEDVFADWDTIRANTRGFLAGPEAEDLSREVSVEVGGYPRMTLTIEQILFHIANH
jgi:uncharacterized damage-inducible protein DinB